MATKQEYIENLKWRLQEIEKEITELQNEIQEKFILVDNKQAQAQNLIMLLESEGVDYKQSSDLRITNNAISEIVYKFMSEQETHTPLHYADITKKLMGRGIFIPGKNPPSNLLSNINRDVRFIRTAPGTYGLKEWGLKALPSRKRKTRKKKK